MTLCSINNYFFVVSAFIFDVSADILEVVSAIGAILDVVSVGVTAVESLGVSELEEPPLQAANEAETKRITNNFFMLI